MSNIKIQGNASGTGTVTLAAPNTNTDRTLTLPDGAGEILTNASSLPAANLTGTLPALDGSALTGVGGLSEWDQWRVAADQSRTDNQVITNWERVDTYGWQSDKSGTGMSENAGVFTFPSTGMWKIDWRFELYNNLYWHTIRLYVTTDGTNYANATYNETSTTASVAFPQVDSYIFNVDNTSNCKLYWDVWGDGGSLVVKGNTATTRSSVKFIKIGEAI